MKPLFKLIFIFLTLSNLGYSQTWTKSLDFPGAERDDAAGFVIGHEAYLGTGMNSSFSATGDFYKYNFWTDSWSSIANLPFGEERQYACGFSHNGKGYLFGGVDKSKSSLNDLWEYNPETDSWKELKAKPGNGIQAAAHFKIGNKLYIIGGRDDSNYAIKECWSFDIPSATWTRLNDLPYSIWRGSGAEVNGKGYVFFGQHNDKSYNKSILEYDVTSDSWLILGIASGKSPSTHVQVLSINNSIYSIGGKDSLNNYTNQVCRLNSILSNWETIAELPTIDIPTKGLKGGIALNYQMAAIYTTGIDSNNFRRRESYVNKYISGTNSGISKITPVLFPNPAEDFIILNLEYQTGLSFQLSDLTGRLILKKKLSPDLKIPLIGIHSGTYLIQLFKNDALLLQQNFLKN